METVLTRASESILFGQKSIKNGSKEPEKLMVSCLGARCRRFKSCHSDQKITDGACPCLWFFVWCVDLNLFCQAKCRFTYPARRLTGSLVRRSAWASRSEAELPCHSDHRQCRLPISGVVTANFFIHHAMVKFVMNTRTIFRSLCTKNQSFSQDYNWFFVYYLQLILLLILICKITAKLFDGDSGIFT